MDLEPAPLKSLSEPLKVPRRWEGGQSLTPLAPCERHEFDMEPAVAGERVSRWGECGAGTNVILAHLPSYRYR